MTLSKKAQDFKEYLNAVWGKEIPHNIPDEALEEAVRDNAVRCTYAGNKALCEKYATEHDRNTSRI